MHPYHYQDQWNHHYLPEPDQRIIGPAFGPLGAGLLGFGLGFLGGELAGPPRPYPYPYPPYPPYYGPYQPYPPYGPGPYGPY